MVLSWFSHLQESLGKTKANVNFQNITSSSIKSLRVVSSIDDAILELVNLQSEIHLIIPSPHLSTFLFHLYKRHLNLITEILQSTDNKQN
jgi:hypothetical protein